MEQKKIFDCQKPQYNPRQEAMLAKAKGRYGGV